jgi:hypothetical protein
MDHLDSIDHVKVFYAEGGGQIFGFKIRRELMLKMIDLIHYLLFLCYSAWFPKLSLEVKMAKEVSLSGFPVPIRLSQAI